MRLEKKTNIKIPLNLKLPSLIIWSKLLWAAGNEINIELDFAGTRFFTPFSMIFIIQQIELYYKTNPSVQIKFINVEQCEWAENMNLFSALKAAMLDKNNSFNYKNVTHKTNTFLPITTLDTSEFKRQNGRSLDEINEAVDAESAQLTQALTQLGSGPIFDAIQYSMREIMRNVFEHSGAKLLRYCAQFYPNGRRAELIVADNGMGVHSSIVGNKNYRNLTARETIHLACLPGVSGNEAALRDRVPSNPWKNTGYGLYMTSRLCKNYGDFLIISSDRALSLTSKGKQNFFLDRSAGTIIRLHLNLEKLFSFKEKLAEYASEGKKISEEIYGAKVLDASAASQMLRRDFTL